MTDKIKKAAQIFIKENYVLFPDSLTLWVESITKFATSEAAREYWEGQGWVRVEDGFQRLIGQLGITLLTPVGYAKKK